RRAAFGAVIEVVDVMVVEVDRLLHQPQPERIGTEIQIGLRLIDSRRHVMQSDDRVRHWFSLTPDSGAAAGVSIRWGSSRRSIFQGRSGYNKGHETDLYSGPESAPFSGGGGG